MLAIAALVSSAAAFGPKGNNKKNVLYFIADDLRPEFAAPYWQKQVGGAATPQTPSGFSPPPLFRSIRCLAFSPWLVRFSCAGLLDCWL